MSISNAPLRKQSSITPTLLAVIVVVCWLLFVGYSWVHAFATCRGHVVKNWADFPVCVS